jgi:hypothetical protein
MKLKLYRLETTNGKPNKTINMYDQSRLGVILCSIFYANFNILNKNVEPKLFY